MAEQDERWWEPNAELAWRTLRGESTLGIPSWALFVMEHREIERLAGAAPGAYAEDAIAFT